MFLLSSISLFFFFNDTATTEIYTLSLHDALPISPWRATTWRLGQFSGPWTRVPLLKNCVSNLLRIRWKRVSAFSVRRDRKSTRLNSSHSQISYAVFCLKKKKKKSQI